MRRKRVTWLEHISLGREALDLLKRRPCRDVDVSESLGIDLSYAREFPRELEKKRLVNVTKANGERFYFKTLSHVD